jgi:hypothetical protein
MARPSRFYENRIPELQLINEGFPDQLTALLEAAELDEHAEGQLARKFGQQYMLFTRPAAPCCQGFGFALAVPLRSAD